MTTLGDPGKPKFWGSGGSMVAKLKLTNQVTGSWPGMGQQLCGYGRVTGLVMMTERL